VRLRIYFVCRENTQQAFWRCFREWLLYLSLYPVVLVTFVFPCFYLYPRYPWSSCWRWNSVNLTMSLPLVLALVLYIIHWYYPLWYNKFIRACQFWSLVFMQGFSIESKTSGISSSSTLWQDLEARYKSCNEANLTPRRPGTKPKKMTNSEDLARKVSILRDKELHPTRRETDDKGPHAKGGRI
jgi:hypothetical protein